MARLTKKEILALTPQQIEQMRRTNLTQLKRITSDLQAINRKSYLRSKAARIDSPFVASYEKSGGPTSLKSFRGSANESQQVKNELMTQLSLTQAKTRTFVGAQKVYKEMVNRIDPEHKRFKEDIKEMDKEDIGMFWKVYNKLAEKHANLRGGGTDGSPPANVSAIITSQLEKGGDVDEILARVDEIYQKIYEEEEVGGDYNENPFILPEDEF